MCTKPKNNKKEKTVDEEGPKEAGTSAGKPYRRSSDTANTGTDRDSVLSAIETLHAELYKTKQEICIRIETDSTSKVEEYQAAAATNAMAIKELELAITANSDAVTSHKSEIKYPSMQLSKLSEKSINLEGQFKRQNLRIA